MYYKYIRYIRSFLIRKTRRKLFKSETCISTYIYIRKLIKHYQHITFIYLYIVIYIYTYIYIYIERERDTFCKKNSRKFFRPSMKHNNQTPISDGSQQSRPLAQALVEEKAEIVHAKCKDTVKR